MLKSRTLLEMVDSIYFDLKTKRYSIMQKNQEVLSSNEKYIQLSNELGKAKFLLAKAEYNGDEFEIEKLKSQVKTLEKLITKLVNTLPVQKYEYQCPKCKDTGVVNDKRCRCYNRNLTKIALSALEIPETEGSSFSSVIPSPELNKQFKIIKNYADNFPNTQINNMVFIGTVGSGKTLLSKCVLNSVKNTDNIAVFLNASDLNNVFLKIHTAQIDRTLTFEVLCDTDLLIIDDLGTENLFKNVTVEYLLSLISCRLERNKHFIITTNLSTQELYDRYTERLFSRLSDKSKTLFIPFNSTDKRRHK